MDIIRIPRIQRVRHEIVLVHRWDAVFRDLRGRKRWEGHIEKNLVVNTGLDRYLALMTNQGALSDLYVGLLASTPTVAAADTMASHAGWTEITTEYTEAARPTVAWDAVSGQSVANGATSADFSINSNVTVGGAFLATDATKGGTAGTLISGDAWSGGDASLSTGTLSVTLTLTAAAA